MWLVTSKRTEKWEKENHKLRVLNSKLKLLVKRLENIHNRSKQYFYCVYCMVKFSESQAMTNSLLFASVPDSVSCTIVTRC